jgi:hypothetical protein
MERLHAAAFEAEGRIAVGPSRDAPRAAVAAVPPPKASEPGSALERLRAAMVEAEAKLLSNGQKAAPGARAARSKARSRSRSRSPRRAAAAAAAAAAGAPLQPGTPLPEGEAGEAPTEGEAPAAAGEAPAADPEAVAVPQRKALSALEQLRRALADADARINDTQGKHWLGAHEPTWKPGPQWPRGDANMALRAKLTPMDRERAPWPLVEKMRVASAEAAVDVGVAASAAVRNTALAGKFGGDVHARLLGRFGTPPAVRPNFWAHGADLELPGNFNGRRHLAKLKTPVPKPPPPPRPPVQRSQSTGRISLSFSSPARHEYKVELSMGATLAPTGGAMSDMPSIGTSAVLSKTWKHVPQILPQCVRESLAAAAAPVDLFEDVALPGLSEKSHDPRAPRHTAAGKAEALAEAGPEPARRKEPYAPAALRPRREDALAPEEDEAPSTSARPKPQRGPHVVRRKARKMPRMTVEEPEQSVYADPPPRAPDAATGASKPRALLRPPPKEDDGDDAVFDDGLMLFTSESAGTEGPLALDAPHDLPAPTAPPTPLPADVAAPAPLHAQPELAFTPRDSDPPGRGAAKRWRMRRRTERQEVSVRTFKRSKVTLTRWEAACVIQAFFRGMEARRLMSAIKARVLLSTHLSEKALTGKATGFDAEAMAPQALRHVKVLAEFYEKSSGRAKFATATASAVAASTARTATNVSSTATTGATARRRNGAPLSVAPLPAKPNPLLKIYEQQGEAAALEAAAREALTWTNWMVPDIAKEAEDDATLAAVRAFRDMLKEGEAPADTRQFANRIALKAAAEVVGPAIAELTAHGLNADHYQSASTTIANRVRDGKEALGDEARARKVPTIAHDAEHARTFEKHFDKLRDHSGKAAGARAPAASAAPPTPAAAKPARATATLSPAPVSAKAAAKAAPQPASVPVKAAVPAAKAAPPPVAAPPVAVPAGKRNERSWFDSAASLFTGNRGLTQAAAATRIQSAVRAMRARRQLDILKARVELRAAVAAVRDKGIAAQPAVLDRTMALGDAYLRAWNLPRAEQCYTHVLETMERDYGRGDVRCVRPASALARVYRERGEPQRAIEVMRRATAPSPKPVATPSPPRDALSAALGGFGLFGGATAAAAAPATGSKVLDSAAVGVQDALANTGKAMQGAADNLAGALGLGWLSSQAAAPRPTA